LTLRLVVTADDLGLHPGINSGVIESHRNGIVTACSIVANGEAFDDAVARLLDAPSLDVGAHLTLVEERPLLQARHVPSLVDRSGRMFKDFRSFSLRYASGRILMEDVERELRAQMEHVLGAGLRPLHLNGHQHLHVLPEIFELVCSLATEYGIPYVRVPSGRNGSTSVSWARGLSMRVLDVFGSQARERLSRGKLVTADRTLGIHEAGTIDGSRLRRILSSVENGNDRHFACPKGHAEGCSCEMVVEFVAHPGEGDSEIAARYAWGYGWDEERRALCHPDIRDLVEDLHILLCGIGEVVRVASGDH